MRTKLMAASLVLAIIMAMVMAPVPVEGAQIVVGRGADFHFEQVNYPSMNGSLVGPAAYYGEPVRVDYTSTYLWKSIYYSKNGSVIEKVEQIDGTAMIYAAGPDQTLGTSDDMLLDVRHFYAFEEFFDKGGDASYGTPGDYYTVDAYEGDMEGFLYTCNIAGVYTIEIHCTNGYWVINWVSDGQWGHMEFQGT